MADIKPEKRAAWLKAGIDVLSASGPGALTLDELTARMGLTKGSFYHHFKDREGFVSALLEYWEEQMTHRLIQQAEAGGTTRDKQRRLTHLAMALYGSKLELNIRAWARNSPLVRRSVKRVDQARITYLATIARDITGDPKRAMQLAEIAYAVFVGAQQVVPPVEREDLLKLYGELNRLYA